ncbi:MAG: hemolysin family protein [Paraburkholderia sp.]|uniref:hemolysin family protein n=1 Tax=unclassified Paraburkholderia TaxID=2615204 RepID=UPI00285BE96D|nr:hemolysin family protein [Paraburkholderia sp. USG1]MDR8394748.1 hemolysin family protein [Paraburkholderia sp. USG1]
MLLFNAALFLFFVALTAFFNIAEMALVASRKPKLDALVTRPSASAALAIRLKEDPGTFLSAIQAGITVTSILAGTFCVTAFAVAAESLLERLTVPVTYARPLGSAASILIAAYLTLVFGELAPKRLALSSPEYSAALIARPLDWTIRVARPFVLLLRWSNDVLMDLARIPAQTDDETNEDEIRSVISSALRSGSILDAERNMMESILQLRIRTVRTIMTPRRHLEWVDRGMTEEELSQRIAESPCSKLIVTQGRDIDRPLGVAAKKDILRLLLSTGKLDFEALCQPPAFVAQNTPILALLSTLKRARAQMLFVVDEFGTVMGIVTLTDVLEAVAGDVPEPERRRRDGEQLRKQPDGTYLVSGQLPADDLAEYLGIGRGQTPTYKTTAGLLLEHFRRLPASGEQIRISGWLFEVAEADARSIQQVRLTPPKDAPH